MKEITIFTSEKQTITKVSKNRAKFVKMAVLGLKILVSLVRFPVVPQANKQNIENR